MSTQNRRLLLDLGPVAIWAAVYFRWGMFPAIAVLIAATITALVIGYMAERKLSAMPAFTCLVVTIFGGVALYLKDAAFFKMKVTFAYALFGTLLLGGLAFKHLLIKYALGHAFSLDEAGWKKLTVRWGVFFLFLAVLNEVIWRNFSEQTWVYAKIGMIAATFLFALAQTPLVMKHQAPEAARGADGAQD